MTSEELPVIRRRSIVGPATAVGLASDSSAATSSASYHPHSGSDASLASDFGSSDTFIRQDNAEVVESIVENSTGARGVKWGDQASGPEASPQMQEAAPPMTSHPRLQPLLISRPLHQHLSTVDLPHRVGSRRDVHAREEPASNAGDLAAAAARRPSVRFANHPPPLAIAEESGTTTECSCPSCPGHHQSRISATETSPYSSEPISRQISINGSMFSFQASSPPHRQASTFTTHSMFTASVNPARPPTFGRDLERATSLTESVLDLHDEIYEDDDDCDTTKNNLLPDPSGFIIPAKRRWKSTATMFTGHSKAQRVITRDFLLALTRAFSRYGAPSHRIEYMMELVALALEQPASFVVIPGMRVPQFRT
ncbi:hypothetical protein HDU86_002502 [Geranomyces michiganensis]|nr:hypothetical protein HDU86_002502 [Geranomyces michiganensis]